MGGSANVNRKARYWVTGLGVISLIIAVLVFGKTAREQYYIWRLGSEDLNVSQRAATTLATMGSSRAFPYIVIVIDNTVVSQGIRPPDIPQEEILRPYIDSLAEIVRKNLQAVLSHLRRGLRHEKPHLRALHANLVSETSVPTLVSFLKDDDDHVRIIATIALMRMEAADTIPALEELATDTDFSTFAVWVLRAIGPAGVESLLKLLLDRDPDVRMQAAYGLSQTHNVPDEAIPLLTNALTDEYYPLRVAAAKALGSIGPRAKDAFPTLTELLNDKNRHVRAAAVDALKRIRDP